MVSNAVCSCFPQHYIQRKKKPQFRLQFPTSSVFINEIVPKHIPLLLHLPSNDTSGVVGRLCLSLYVLVRWCKKQRQENRGTKEDLEAAKHLRARRACDTAQSPTSTSSCCTAQELHNPQEKKTRVIHFRFCCEARDAKLRTASHW